VDLKVFKKWVTDKKERQEVIDMFKKVREKYGKMQVKTEQKDIETIKKNPMAWKAYMIVIAAANIGLAVFFMVIGAYPLAVIATVFIVWLIREMFILYRKAIPKQKIYTNVKFNY